MGSTQLHGIGRLTRKLVCWVLCAALALLVVLHVGHVLEHLQMLLFNVLLAAGTLVVAFAWTCVWIRSL
jgi:hypothetical protein